MIAVSTHGVIHVYPCSAVFICGSKMLSIELNKEKSDVDS
jgi:hypothetical protein